MFFTIGLDFIFSWFIASLIALSYGMRLRERRRPFTFIHPANSNPNERSFLQYFEDYFSQNLNIVWDPVPMLRSLIRQMLGNRMDVYFDQIGDCQSLFTAFSHHRPTSDFFAFARPTISERTNINRCPVCKGPSVRDAFRTEVEALVQLSTFDAGFTLTLKELVEDYFKPEEELSDIPCNQADCPGVRTRRTKNILAAHVDLLVISLGREKYDRQLQQMVYIRDKIQFGDDVVLTSRDGTIARYTLVSAVQHL